MQTAGMTRKTGAKQDYFSLLGVSRAYHLNADELEQKYLTLSKERHPDRFVKAETRKRVAALQESMELNNAYKTLKKPVSRAEYLLTLEGVEIGANETLDPNFLAEMLEWREELQQAKQRTDGPAIRKLEEQALDRRDEALVRIGRHFSVLASAADKSALLDEVKRELILLRYVHRYLEVFDDLLE